MATQRTTGTLLQSLQRRYAAIRIQTLNNHNRIAGARFATNVSLNGFNSRLRQHSCNHLQNQHQHQHEQRRDLAYASVKHDEEYKNEMEGPHGEQLKLALKEAEIYEHEEVDPFELYKIVDASDDAMPLDDDDSEESEEAEFQDDDDEEEYDDEEDETELGESYTAAGNLKRTKAELVSFKAGAPAGGKFAIIDLNGSQQKVTVDDVVIVNKLKPIEKWAVGSTHTLNAEDGQVLLLGSQEQTFVGMPFVNGGEVDVMVEEITRDKKVIVFKKKRRKNYRRKNGFKRQVTFLRVLDIRFP